MSALQAIGCVSAAFSVLMIVSFLGFTVGNGVAASTDCITESKGGARLCVGRAELVEVGQNMSLSIALDERETSKPIYSRHAILGVFLTCMWEKFIFSLMMPSVQVDGWSVIGVTVDSEQITTLPPQVVVQNGSGEVILFGRKAGRTVVHFHCELNETLSNQSVCQSSWDNLYFLQREVSFVNSLSIEIVSYIVGWIYCFVWSFYYYPQMFLNFKRCSVSGFSMYRILLSFSGSVAYAIFNVGLFWIPELQAEYFRRHPGGVIPVLINDVVFSLNSLFAAGVWVFQALLFNSIKYKRSPSKRTLKGGLVKENLDIKKTGTNLTSTGKTPTQGVTDYLEDPEDVKDTQLKEMTDQQKQDGGPTMKQCGAVAGSLGGGLFISCLWLLMLSTVIASAFGFLEWLDALYIISYIKIVTITLQYTPQMWLNCRRKSTEGCSAYSPILAVIGGVFSVLQMFLLSYNYDDWKSIFGDPTKFGIGVLVALFCSFIVFQHYVLYRKSWLKTYELPVACSCEPGCCKCSKEESSHSKKSNRKISDTVALPGGKLQLKKFNNNYDHFYLV